MRTSIVLLAALLVTGCASAPSAPPPPSGIEFQNLQARINLLEARLNQMEAGNASRPAQNTAELEALSREVQTLRSLIYDRGLNRACVKSQRDGRTFVATGAECPQ